MSASETESSWRWRPHTGRSDIIAHIAPMSFQTPMPHKPRQVKWGEVHASVVTEWPLASLHKLLPRRHQTAIKVAHT